MTTVRVNLLPAEYQLRAKRPRRFKVWLALSIAMVVAVTMSSLFLRLKADDTRIARQQVAQMRQEHRKLTKALALLTAQRRALARRIALTRRLRRKHRWSRAFAALTRHLPDNVVLTRLASDPPRDLNAGRGRPEATNPTRQHRQEGNREAPTATARGFLIDGMAVDHESVAAFLGALDDDDAYGICELKSTSRQRFMDNYAVAFTIHTHW